MKTFVVTTLMTSTRTEDGHLVQAAGHERTVRADYYRIVEGDLIFRTEKSGNEQYNPAVRTFARGYWAEVYEKKTLQESVAEYRQRAEPAVAPDAYHAREVDLPPHTIDVPIFLGENWP